MINEAALYHVSLGTSVAWRGLSFFHGWMLRLLSIVQFGLARQWTDYVGMSGGSPGRQGRTDLTAGLRGLAESRLALNTQCHLKVPSETLIQNVERGSRFIQIETFFHSPESLLHGRIV